MKHQVHARPLAGGAVGRERPRIGRVVFVGSELGGVDENRNHRGSGLLPGDADQRQVSGMQISHCGHEPNAFALGPEDQRGLLHFKCGFDDSHRELRKTRKGVKHNRNFR